MVDAPLPIPGAEQRDRRAALGYAMTLAAATLFAVNGSVSKLALEASGMGTLRWTELRSTGAFLGLLVALVVLAPARLRVDRREALALVTYGVIGFAFVQWLYFVAIYRLPIGIGLLLEFTAPVLVALWARFVWRERVRDRVWLALGLVLVGLVLVAQVWSGLTLDRLGVVAGLAAAIALPSTTSPASAWSCAATRYSLVCFAIGAASGFWAVVQPWWSFPFATLGEQVALPGSLDDVSCPCGRSRSGRSPSARSHRSCSPIGALRHLPATTVTIVADLRAGRGRGGRLGVARRDADGRCRWSAARSCWPGILLAETSR